MPLEKAFARKKTQCKVYKEEYEQNIMRKSLTSISFLCARLKENTPLIYNPII